MPSWLRALRRWMSAAACVLGTAACSGGTDGGGVGGLRFEAVPATTVAGAPIEVRVQILDGSGEPDDGARALVTLSLSGGAVVSGPTVVESVLGVATFPGVTLTQAGAGFRLQAAASGRTAMSDQLTVQAAAPSGARSAFDPVEGLAPEATPIAVTFTFADAYGNPLASVPVTLSSSLPGSSFNPASGTTSASGTFTTNFLMLASGTATVSAMVAGQATTFAVPFEATVFCESILLTVPGQQTGSLPRGVCDSNGRPAAVYKFNRATQGGVAFTTSGAFPPRVDVKTGLFERSIAFIATPQVPTIEWLLPAGTYLYRVATNNNSVGAYNVTATPVAANTGTNVRALVRGGTYAGQSLAVNDREFGDFTVYDQYYISSSRPCTITMRSTAFDAYLWIEDAVEQFTIDADDNGGGGTDARVTLPACSVGNNPIGILANSNLLPGNQPGLGAYTLIVEIQGEGAFVLGSSAATAARELIPAPALDLERLSRPRDLSAYVAQKAAMRRGGQ